MSYRLCILLALTVLLAGRWHPVLALQVYSDVAIEGFDPCASGDESDFSGYQVVATKPDTSSDFTSNEGQNCGVPVQRCGDPVDVEAACKQYPGCVAFNYDGRCGYLKTAAQPRSQRAGWGVYVLTAPSASAGSPAPPSPQPIAQGGRWSQAAGKMWKTVKRGAAVKVAVVLCGLCQATTCPAVGTIPNL